jgi:hypothetical protein
MTETPDSLGSGVALEDRLPIRCQPMPAHSDAFARQQANEEVLRVILSLDEIHRSELHEQDPALAQELVRLESKIDLVLELVGQLLVRQLMMPEPVLLRVFAGRVEWETTAAPAVGQPVLVELFICNRIPRPLWLPATMIGAPKPGWAAARFGDLGDSVQDQLEKLIFRHHRRRVAVTRRGGVG